MITEKQMKIVDAVNEMKADSAYLGATTVWVCSFGGYRFGFNVTSQTICTIEEYNQCIKEMKYHRDIPKWYSCNRADKELLSVENSDYSFYEKETFVHGQDVYVNNTVYSNKKFKFGCFALDNKRALLFYVNVDAYCRVTVESISSKPIKSKKDIELEEAKKKQVDEIMKRHAAKFCRPEQFKSAIKAMQENGDLAPIKLTEEE